MKRPCFDENELRVIAMYDTSSRPAVIRELRNANQATKDDPEINAVVMSCLYKLWRTSNEDFSLLNLAAYRYDGEAEE